MKNTLIAVLSIAALGIVSISSSDAFDNDGISRSVMLTKYQQLAEPTPATQTIMPQEPAPVLQAPMVQPGPMMAMPAAGCCNACGCQRCCCPPPCPVPTKICICDPCNGCTYEVCVQAPPCCAGQQPVVSWRNGIFGRRVASVCWNCCDAKSTVVVTRRGKVKVRG